MEGTQGQQQVVVIYSKSSREKRGNYFKTGFLLDCAGQRPMHRKMCALLTGCEGKKDLSNGLNEHDLCISLGFLEKDSLLS